MRVIAVLGQADEGERLDAAPRPARGGHSRRSRRPSDAGRARNPGRPCPRAAAPAETPSAPGDDLLAQPDGAPVGGAEARDQAEQRRLAAAAGSSSATNAPADLERHVLHGPHRAEALETRSSRIMVADMSEQPYTPANRSPYAPGGCAPRPAPSGGRGRPPAASGLAALTTGARSRQRKPCRSSIVAVAAFQERLPRAGAARRREGVRDEPHGERLEARTRRARPRLDALSVVLEHVPEAAAEGWRLVVGELALDQGAHPTQSSSEPTGR